jgi:hypothetical protein
MLCFDSTVFPGVAATMRASIVLFLAFCLSACNLPTNVALKRLDGLRAEQEACLSGNVVQFEDAALEPSKVGHFVALSCTYQTDKLTQYAVPYPDARERAAFRQDAELRATGHVMRGRGQIAQ